MALSSGFAPSINLSPQALRAFDLGSIALDSRALRSIDRALDSGFAFNQWRNYGPAAGLIKGRLGVWRFARLPSTIDWIENLVNFPPKNSWIRQPLSRSIDRAHETKQNFDFEELGLIILFRWVQN